MFNFFKTAQQYFAPQEIDGKVYVHGGKMQKLIRELDTVKSKASLPDITLTLNLNHRIVGKGKNKPTIADTTVSKGYNKNAMFEMPELCHALIDKASYILDEHYAELDSSSALRAKDEPKVESNYQRMFLTWRGLLKVLFSSRSGNILRHTMADWVVETMFIHQFGSQEERSALARDLTKAYKACLNSKAGVYLVRIAKVKHLRESMSISLDRYSREFDNAYVYKFGLSDDVIRRFGEHSARGGYGCYSTEISLDMIAIYPSSDNDLAQRMISAQKDHELQIVKLQSENKSLRKDLVICEKDRTIDNERHAKELCEKDIELLTLKLQMAANIK